MARIIRKTPLWERIKNKPYDWLFQINESELLNDYVLDHNIGLVLNLVFYVTCLYLTSDSPFKDSDGLFRPEYEQIERSYLEKLGKYSAAEHRSGGLMRPLYHAVSVLHYLLIALSWGNFFACFEKFRTYDLVHRNSEPSSVNCRRKRLNYQDQSEMVWELRVWNSNENNLRLFCLFSPLNVVYMKYIAGLRPIDLIFPLLISGTLYFVTYRYETKLHDRELINSEMLHEYNAKFVYPNTSKAYRDVCCGTDSRTVLVKPTDRRAVFVTHSLHDTVFR